MAKKPKKFIDYTKPLKNVRQELFCQARIAGDNATQAAKKAGYKQPTAQGSRMKDSVDVSGRMKFLLSVVANMCQVTAEKVVSDILNTHSRAKYDNDYTNELKASDMLMRHVGGYEKDNSQHVIVSQEIMTEKELKARLDSIDKAGTGLDERSIG